MSNAIREVIAEALGRDDYEFLRELKGHLSHDQTVLLSLAIQTPDIMRDARLINSFRPHELSDKRRKALLALASLVGKFEVLTNAFIKPLIDDHEILLELLDANHISVQQRIVLLAKTKQAFRCKQTHIARVLTAWLVEHSVVTDEGLYDIYEASIDESGGDEWLFRKMLTSGALASILCKAKSGRSLITAAMLADLNRQSDEVKLAVISKVLRRKAV